MKVVAWLSALSAFVVVLASFYNKSQEPKPVAFRVGVPLVATPEPPELPVPSLTPATYLARSELLGETVASWYGPKFHGRQMANGKPFNQHALTAAHRTLPFGTKLLVVNKSNDRAVSVEITDRGPYAEFKGVKYFEGDRGLDLSFAAAQVLGMVDAGLADVEIYATVAQR